MPDLGDINGDGITDVIIGEKERLYYDSTITNRGYLNSVEDSPRNIGLIFNSPIRSKNMGFGAGILSDQVGVTTTTNIFGAYAYKLVFDHNYNQAR